MPTIHEVLKSHWGYDSFRPLQEDIIRTVLRGEDCLALLPTGGGKSLCFQVPAMTLDGLCLVISPLIALMKDQVSNLRKKNITAFSIFTGMNRQEVKQTLQVAGSSNCKFLYVSPERLETNLFKEYLPSLNVKLIAVDEAHCISQWGYDFRPSYLRIAGLREELPNVPVLALTASATSDVQKDICEKLEFRNQNIFRQSFERPKLSYSVFNVPSKINKIIDILEKVPGTAIVYCRSRKRTKEISDLLNASGMAADFYHAGLPQDQRNTKQEHWIQNRIRVIVCTNAFGMGIDKPDVRVVVHADVPDCLENYYQEAGRAGRDGKRCYAVLLYLQKDLKELRSGVDIKYPPPEKLKEIYGCLMNHLQVPAGSGEGRSFEFDPVSFATAFHLPAATVVAALRVLEQEQHVYFNEQVFVPAKLQVIATRERLHDLEKKRPDASELIKALLRTYEGIMDHETAIQESIIAGQQKIKTEEVKKLLDQLHRAAYVRYSPQKEKPQVYLPINRIRSSDFTINPEKYARRKTVYQERAIEMMRYVQTKTDCRSRFIGVYFGDDNIRECGICDNCLQKKKTALALEEFELIQSRVIEIVRGKRVSPSQLFQQLQNISQHKATEVLRYLEAEQLVRLNADGYFETNVPEGQPSAN
jgi:ATP-dependent DNA helicase RecQ